MVVQYYVDLRMWFQQMVQVPGEAVVVVEEEDLHDQEQGKEPEQGPCLLHLLLTLAFSDPTQVGMVEVVAELEAGAENAVHAGVAVEDEA